LSADGGRDLVGYGSTPPAVRWPGGTRLAVNLVLNYEEGAEYAFEHGDGRSDLGLLDIAQARLPAGVRDLAAESLFEYGSRVGVWRLFRLCESRGVPATVFAAALALERNPAVAAAIARNGWDVAAHGWRWIAHTDLDEATERAHIARAYASIERLTGRPPEGWYCRYAPSANTRRLVVEHGGFTYDSDAYNDELPYWVRVEGRAHLVVPTSTPPRNCSPRCSSSLSNCSRSSKTSSWPSRTRPCRTRCSRGNWRRGRNRRGSHCPAWAPRPAPRAVARPARRRPWEGCKPCWPTRRCATSSVR